MPSVGVCVCVSVCKKSIALINEVKHAYIYLKTGAFEIFLSHKSSDLGMNVKQIFVSMCI